MLLLLYRVQTTFFFVEVQVVIIALEVAKCRGWNNLWIECESSLIIQAFGNPLLVPWRLHGKWEKWLFFCKDIVFCYSRVYREWNSLADKLAKLDTSTHDSTLGGTLSLAFLGQKFLRNIIYLPSYRFC